MLLQQAVPGNFPGLPSEPEAVLDAAEDPSNAESRLRGVGALAYVHAGLRWERGFRSRTTIGYRVSPVRVFAEAGGGVLPLVPGAGDGGLGRPPGGHVGAGVRIGRGGARAITLSLLHLRALRKPEALIQSKLHWTGFRLGFASD